MKKILSSALCVLMLLGCIVLPVGAAENVYPSIPNLDDALVHHWDFEGSTPGNDKSGKSASHIGNTTKGYKQSKFENGVAIHGAGADTPTTGTDNPLTSMLSNSGTGALAHRGDSITKNTTGEFTFYLNFKLYVDETQNFGTGTHQLMRLLGVDGKEANVQVRIFTKDFDKNANSVKIYGQSKGMSSAALIATIDYDAADGANDQYFRVALTMKYNTAAEQWNHTYYLSADNGKTWSDPVTATSNDAVNFSSVCSGLYLGNTNGSTKLNKTYFDDFRIYNKALSAEELTTVNREPAAGAVFHGVQEVTTGEDFDVRFIGSIDSLEYAEVGFVITAQDGAYKWEKSVSKVYTTVLANNGLKEYTAAELRKGSSGYIYALSITDVPIKAEGGEIALDVTFIVTPYYVKESGGARVSGNSYTVCYSGGAFKSISVNPAA